MRDIIAKCTDNTTILEHIHRRIEIYYSYTLLELRSVETEQSVDTSSQLEILRFLEESCELSSMPFKQQELYHHLALLVMPTNHAAAKNYAFVLEYSNHYTLAKLLYSDCHSVTHNLGCLLHAIMASPTVLTSPAQAEYIYISMLSDLYQLLGAREYTTYNNLDQLYDTFREIPINIHYLGYNPGVVLEMTSRCLVKFFPALDAVHIPPPPLQQQHAALAASAQKTVIRLGILAGKHSYHCVPVSLTLQLLLGAEYRGNSSPGLCLQHVFTSLSAAFPSLQLIFFDRFGLNTVFAEAVRAVAWRVVAIDQTDVVSSVTRLIRQQLDVLAFMALPTEKFAFFLAHHR